MSNWEDAAHIKGPEAAPGRWLLRRFTLISLALTLLATALTTFAMGWVVESYLLGQVAQESGRRLDRIVLPLLPSGTLAGPLSEDRLALLDADVREQLLEPPVQRLTLWDKGGQLLYESGPVEAPFDAEHLAAALAGEHRHQVIEVPGGRRLRILLPIVRDGAVVGSYGIEQDFEPLAAHVAEMQRFAAASLVGFSVALYLLLFRLVRRAARDLNREVAANTRLYREALRSSSVASALLRTSETLSHLGPLDQLLEEVSGRALELVGADDTLIFLAGEGGRRFALRASAGVPAEKLAVFPLRMVDPSTFAAFERLCSGGGPLVVEDAPNSPFVPSDLAMWHGARSCAFLPLEVGGRVEGAMVIHYTREPHRFTDEELRLATGLASQAAVAIANTRAFESVRTREEHFRALVQNASDLIAILEADGTIRYASPSLERVLGYRPEERLGSSLFDLVHPDEVARVRSVLTDALRRPGERRAEEFCLRHRDGTWRHVEAVASNLLEVASVGGIVVNAWDITERKSFEEQLTRQAFYDALTGLPNRALFMNRLEHALVGAPRRTGSVAVLFLDLDRFKVVNDGLGHTAGDALLRAVGERLAVCMRPGDTVARLGGDEFAILLEDVANPGDACVVAERIMEQFSAPFTLNGHTAFVTTSIGIAFRSPSLGDARDILRDADVALYRAKAAGRACYAVFDASMDAYSVDRLQLETDLRQAIQRGELRLHYQPELELDSGRMVGVEALVRWQHPTRGLVSPADFIPLAEETGLIAELGRWVLEQACWQARAWQDRFPSASPLTMSVNLSARQFRQPDLVEQVAGVLRRAGLSPHSLKLEITESVLLDDLPSALTRLAALKTLGVRVAIDDFGTGYSSLSYLRQLPVDTVKVDRSFVSDLAGDERTLAVVGAIITLAHAMDMDVTAEGIESHDQCRHLRQLGCDRGQGYYFARPLPQEQIAALLAERRFDPPLPLGLPAPPAPALHG